MFDIINFIVLLLLLVVCVLLSYIFYEFEYKNRNYVNL